MLTDYAGIDYGHGATNVDHKTGIRYGVIPANHVIGYLDNADPVYGKPACPRCGNPVRQATREKDVHCKECKEYFWDYECYPESPLGYRYARNGIIAESSYDNNDIFIVKSPYFTYAQYCSPCAPGACYLLSPLIDSPMGNKCYCFPPDMFYDGEECPYPVYHVKTGKLVWTPAR